MTRKKTKMVAKLKQNFPIAREVDVSKVVAWPKDKVLTATETG